MLQAQTTYGLPTNLTSSALVYTGAGTVSGVIVSSHTSGTLKLWDSLTAAGTVIFNTYTFASGSQSISFYGVKFNTGLFATIGGTNVDLSLIWNPYQG